MRGDLANIEGQLTPLDRQISLASASLLEPAELAGQLRAASDVTVDGNDALLGDIESLRGIQRLLRDAETALCRYGSVLIGECNYVRSRTERIDHEMRDLQRSTLPTVSEREQAAAREAEQAERLVSTVGRLQQRLDAMNRRKNDLTEQRRNLKDQIRRIPLILAEIEDWAAIAEGRKANTPLQNLELEAANTEAEVEATRRYLDQLITAQAQLVNRFEERFDSIVRQTLGAESRGFVLIEEDGVHFKIRRGESLSGEAYRDVGNSPGGFGPAVREQRRSRPSSRHSHPRQPTRGRSEPSDLPSTLDVADEHMRQSSRGEDLPYQYIVTTTTPPSQKLEARMVTRLRLSGGKGALFGRQLGSPTSGQARRLSSATRKQPERLVNPGGSENSLT